MLSNETSYNTSVSYIMMGQTCVNVVIVGSLKQVYTPNDIIVMTTKNKRKKAYTICKQAEGKGKVIVLVLCKLCTRKGLECVKQVVYLVHSFKRSF